MLETVKWEMSHRNHTLKVAKNTLEKVIGL